MHHKLLITVFTLLTLMAMPVFARQAIPIINYDNTPVVNAKKLSSAQVLQAIKLAAGKQHWIITQEENGAITASILVRQKHTVVISIQYNAENYSIHYKDSNNMKYEKEKDGSEVIHPFYNKWVGALNDAIRLELSKL